MKQQEKTKASKKQIEEIHTCGECLFAQWYYTPGNLDTRGSPICCRCKYSKRARIRSERCCSNWKGKK